MSFFRKRRILWAVGLVVILALVIGFFMPGHSTKHASAPTPTANPPSTASATETAAMRSRQETSLQNQINALTVQQQKERYLSPAWEHTGGQLASLERQLNIDVANGLTPAEKAARIQRDKTAVLALDRQVAPIQRRILALTPSSSFRPSAQVTAELKDLYGLKNGIFLQMDTMSVDIFNLEYPYKS
jgi:uncharacterized membrane protein YdfJ with MMPL/SSD domain